MLAIISTIFQILYLIIKNKFDKDAEKRKEMNDLHKEAYDALKSANASQLNSLLVKLKK